MIARHRVLKIHAWLCVIVPVVIVVVLDLAFEILTLPKQFWWE